MSAIPLGERRQRRIGQLARIQPLGKREAALSACQIERQRRLDDDSLLKYVQFRKDAAGESWEIFYLRDKESREVDFVVTFNRRVHWLIEVKASDDNPGTNLKYNTEKLRPHESLKLVLNLDRAQEKSGIKILPLGKWLEELPFRTNGA